MAMARAIGLTRWLWLWLVIGVGLGQHCDLARGMSRAVTTGRDMARARGRAMAMARGRSRARAVAMGKAKVTWRRAGSHEVLVGARSHKRGQGHMKSWSGCSDGASVGASGAADGASVSTRIGSLQLPMPTSLTAATQKLQRVASGW